MQMKTVHVWKCFIALLALLVLTDSQQDQSGFISIDCGTEASYTDKSSSLTYTTDSDYIESGVNMDISPFYKVTTQKRHHFDNVRSFPEGIRNCYRLKLPKGKDTSYLLRAYFMYGNYDNLNNPPEFELHLGVDLWHTVKLENASQIVSPEIIHAPFTDYLDICLVDIGFGTPFISGIELRHLNDSIYKRSSGSLDRLIRYYTYTTSLDNIRYTDDIYDRIWRPMYFGDGSSINTSMEVNSLLNVFKLPSSVMQAAITPTTLTSKPISFTHKSNNPNTEFSVFLHIAELQSLSSPQVREFNITFNGLHFYGPYVPLYLTSDTIYNNVSLIASELNISFHSTNRSTLPPIVNAVEIFIVKQFSKRFTNEVDVDAMMDIKSFYSRTKTWQGDPCLPKAYSWTDLNCSYYSSSSPRITSLNLSSNGLTGDIPESIANLTALQILDLSNNDLGGQIPVFLSDLSELKILKLEGNNFTGPIPEKLLEKSRKGSLNLSVEDNPGVCSSTSCTSKKKKKTFIGPVAACAALVVLLLAGFISFLVVNRRKKQKSVKIEDKIDNVEPGYRIKRQGELARFSYSDVTNMTNKFQKELGQGGFGIVYYGSLKDGTEVAVKMLSQSIHASQQFSTEVELLMSIRHKNLVSLIGYCEEGSHLAIIYEYMAGGDLLNLLSASHSLSWKERLQIAIDSAQGLDYLHNGCRPPIVHRDVKTPNILLNKNLQAKIADFGLSKIFPDENKSYVSTRVIGTPGYLDPEYHLTEQLSEKSDVYSFGVVLLELMTGKPAVLKGEELERVSLAQWISKRLEGGDIWSIVDEKMSEVHNLNSLWRSTDIAMMCVKLTSSGRPTMSNIVTELKECLAMELDPGNSRTNSPDELIEMSPVIPFSAIGPSAR